LPTFVQNTILVKYQLVKNVDIIAKMTATKKEEKMFFFYTARVKEKNHIWSWSVTM